MKTVLAGRMFAAKAYIRFNMSRYIFIFFLFLSGSIGLHASDITKDSAFRNVKRLFEEKPFVHEGSVYKIYEMKLSGDTFQYKIFIENQDSKKSKIYIHRSYDILLKEVGSAYFTTVAENLSWVTFSTESRIAIRETILPEPKPKMIPLPVSCAFTNKAYLPVEFSKPEYADAINTLKSLM